MKLIITESEKNQIKSLYNIVSEDAKPDVITLNNLGQMMYDGKIYDFYRKKGFLPYVKVKVLEFRPVGKDWFLKGTAMGVTASETFSNDLVEEIKKGLKSGKREDGKIVYEGEFNGKPFKLLEAD